MVFRFELEPYWHQRVSFWVGFGLLVLAGGVAGHGIRIRAIAERNRALQREVSQRIAAEEEQQRITRRLSMAERMEAVGRLAGGIAHDFNNLLTAVAGTSTVLRGIHEERNIAELGSPLLDNLDGCVERGASLTRSLLAFARKQPMELVRWSLVRVLERAGYETLSFGDPLALLEGVGPHTDFDILVTDVLMPGMTGDELARRIQKQRPEIPIVFMSGYTDDIRIDALGGRLLHKPFRSADVVRVVEETLAQCEGASASEG